MSHAANIRNRQQQQQRHHHQLDEAPAKRRKTLASGPTTNGAPAIANGIVRHALPDFSAAPSKQVKTSGPAQPIEADAKIRPPNEMEDEESVEEVSSEDDDDDAEADSDSGEDSDGMDVDVDSGSDSDLETSIKNEARVTGREARHASSQDENRDKMDVKMEGLSNGVDLHNDDDGDDDDDNESDSAAAGGEQEEQSFADMLRAKGQGVIEVEDLYSTTQDQSKAMTAPQASHALSVPSANSLGTVLTQALKTNDLDLLESCFQVSNLDSIRATIERLSSSHATNLLQRLAERLHKRPGRAGSLMVWVQWTIVAHGGYLAGQPAAMKELSTLYHVVRQRATGLQPLLALKGKLDMLEAQMELRRNIQSYSKTGVRKLERVTYVEGQESEHDDDHYAGPHKRGLSGRQKEGPGVAGKEIDGSERLLNGIEVDKMSRKKTTEPIVIADDTEEEDDEWSREPRDIPEEVYEDDEDDMDSEDDENLIDDEAEETSDDGESELLSDEVDYDEDEDDAEGNESDDEPAPTHSRRR